MSGMRDEDKAEVRERKGRGASEYKSPSMPANSLLLPLSTLLVALLSLTVALLALKTTVSTTAASILLPAFSPLRLSRHYTNTAMSFTPSYLSLIHI